MNNQLSISLLKLIIQILSLEYFLDPHIDIYTNCYI